MSKGLIGKKLGMMGFFTPDGRYLPVTVIEAGPCVVTQIKRADREGYNALQLGFGQRKASRVNRPLKGHLKKSGGGLFAVLREFPVDNPDDFTLGQEITLELFEVGDRVRITGKSKGRGFSGVIKRHGFHRGPKTHGSKNIRPPGSIGCSAWPSRVTKGKKLPGQYGHEQQTMRNLEIVDIRPEQNLILVKGAVPGHRSALVTIRK
ncbi:MAG: 50S ribosomal protein L3 [Desulfobacterales bacterium]|jgi:large subunit ribosomal protein L3